MASASITAFRRIAVAAVLAFAGLPDGAAAADPAVRTASGALAGKTESGVDTFLGVPYAAAPIGALRWRAPAPPQAWSGTRAATAFGASCVQTISKVAIGPWTPEYLTTDATSEDCLFLNVWRPAGRAGEKLPVLFWIHGGAFTSGSGSVPIYNGAALARQGIIVVNVNYRLGPLGFLSHPDLSAESAGKSSGNFGLQDQVAALRWVNTNIAAFGGDPEQVTIAGQSAGAASVHALMVMPSARGLFRRAIAQSGSGLNTPAPTLAQAEESGVRFAQRFGAKSIADLRAAPADSLLTPPGDGAPPRWGLSVDGAVLPTNPADVAVNYNDTPVLTGLTADEGSGFRGAQYGALTSAALPAALDAQFGALGGEARRLYAAADDRAAGEIAKELVREQGLAATYLWAQGRMKTSKHPVYVYLFSHIEPGPDSARWQAFHSSEIPYVFDTLALSPGRAFTPVDEKIAGDVGRMWVNFVKTGDPNGAGLPRWPGLDLAAPQIMDIGAENRVRPLLPPEKLQLYLKHKANGGRVNLF